MVVMFEEVERKKKSLKVLSEKMHCRAQFCIYAYMFNERYIAYMFNKHVQHIYVYTLHNTVQYEQIYIYMFIFVHTHPPCVFDLLHTSHLLNSTIALYWDFCSNS